MGKSWERLTAQVAILPHTWLMAQPNPANALCDILEDAFDSYRANDPAPCMDLPPRSERIELKLTIPTDTIAQLRGWATLQKVQGTSIVRALLQQAYDRAVETGWTAPAS